LNYKCTRGSTLSSYDVPHPKRSLEVVKSCRGRAGFLRYKQNPFVSCASFFLFFPNASDVVTSIPGSGGSGFSCSPYAWASFPPKSPKTLQRLGSVDFEYGFSVLAGVYVTREASQRSGSLVFTYLLAPFFPVSFLQHRLFFSPGSGRHRGYVLFRASDGPPQGICGTSKSQSPFDALFFRLAAIYSCPAHFRRRPLHVRFPLFFAL